MPNNVYGLTSGTNLNLPLMLGSVVSGATSAPLVTTASVTVDAAFIPSGNIFLQSGNVTLSAGTNYIGQISGNVAASVQSAFVPSGNIFIQSGNAWAGTGSVFNAGGSVNIQGTPSVLGSVTVTNTPSVNSFIVSGNNWAGVGSTYDVGGGFISTNNSTTTTLAANGSFVGTSDEIKNYSTLIVSALTDRNSLASGLRMQFSQDNSNWDFDQPHTVSSGTLGRTFTASPEARYFRIIYYNGADAQGSFRLQTIYKPVSDRGATVPIDGIFKGNTAAIVTRGVIAGQKPDGDSANVGVTAGGAFKVSIEEHPASLPTGTNFMGYVGVTQSGTWFGHVSGNMTILGSVAIITAPLAVSGNAIGLADVNSVQLTFDGGTLPNWRNTGSVFAAGGSLNANIVGSVHVTTNPVNVTPSGTFYSTVTQSGTWFGNVSGNVINLGSVAITNTPSILGSVVVTNAPNVTPSDMASSHRTFIVNVSGTAQNTAVSGTSFPIKWVKVIDYRGSNSSYSGTFAITGTYLKIGSSNSDSIPLWTLTRPDTDVLWAGSLHGDIYVTHQNGPVGSPLVLLVGTV